MSILNDSLVSQLGRGHIQAVKKPTFLAAWCIDVSIVHLSHCYCHVLECLLQLCKVSCILKAKYLCSQLLFLIEMRAVKIFPFELGPTHEYSHKHDAQVSWGRHKWIATSILGVINESRIRSRPLYRTYIFHIECGEEVLPCKIIRLLPQ